VNRRIGLGGALALGISAVLVAPAQGAEADTVYVPDDFVSSLSDTRAGGHFELVGTALHIWTDGTGDVTSDGKNVDKVAEYIATDTPLADVVGEPSLEYQGTPDYLGASSITPPGFQLMVNIDDDAAYDGILIGEPGVYGDKWWLSTGADAEFKDGAPNTGGGYGSPHYGTLAEWSTAFPDAEVTAFGFSLGSGVTADGLLKAINFDGTRYTFAEHTVLESKDECKNGGWAASTKPEFRNQGQCVSSFAKKK
jgi:hypothetical protein